MYPRRSSFSRFNRCNACDNVAAEGKRVSIACMKQVAEPPVAHPAIANPADVISIIKQAVAEGVKEATQSTRHTKHRRREISDSESSMEDSYEKSNLPTEYPESFNDEEFPYSGGFDKSKIEVLIEAVRKSLEEFSVQEPSCSKHIASFKRKETAFLLHESIKTLINDEWGKSEKQVNFQGKWLRYNNSRKLTLPPKLDTSVVRLAKKTILPQDDSSSLREPMIPMILIFLRPTLQQELVCTQQLP
ncbi:Hypothetical predicted protein [Pelobates cultripes]|uniref:Uncharacterized protein n=1 Tax=Pelobates cultripes TaxID=61616 RepID=A0AAD1W869_PELCU|nr:Hypothetical predicted protein [Pelobates cultripes]